jgi:hypothetical protein
MLKNKQDCDHILGYKIPYEEEKAISSKKVNFDTIREF